VDFSTLPPFSDSVRERVRKELGVQPDARLVLGVFRLATEKRPALWLEVANEALSRRQYRDLVFAIAGAGHLREQMDEVSARLQMNDRFRRIEPQGDIGSLYMAADAFLLTSEQEGLPNVVLEAQFYGLPVVATAVGGTPEAMLDGVTGRVVASSDPSLLGAALIEVLNDALLARSATAEGPKFVKTNFSIEQMIRSTLDLYGDN
jgi:glycosyltransferase involved in cell wall biosynthesis